MKFRIVFSLVILAGFMFTGISCSDDDSPSATSRKVTFEVTGNFTGALSTTFITASGGGTTESITSLPWSKEIEYESSVPSASMSIVGAGGTSGQTLTLKVLAGGKQISSTPAVATASGTISVSAPSLIF